MIRLPATALAALFLLIPPALAAEWQIRQAETVLSFEGTQTGTTFTGRFNSWEAAIDFDPANPEAAEIRVTVDMDSARTGDAQRDSALPGEAWFDVANHPQAVFEASGAEATEDGFAATGTLTIKGTSRDITIPFTLEIEDNVARAEGVVVLDRTEFDVGTGQWATGQWVGTEVTVRFEVVADRGA